MGIVTPGAAGARLVVAAGITLTAILILLAGCGSEPPVQISVSGASANDKRIARSIAAEAKASAGAVDVSKLPPDQAATIGPIADNLAGLPIAIDEIAVADGTATVRTDLDAGDEEDQLTAQLICGVILRNVRGGGSGDAVFARDGETVRECERADRNFP